MVGSGVTDFGNIGVMPVSSTPTSSMVTDYGFRSIFSHDNEESTPGYYRVFLEDPAIMVELTRFIHILHQIDIFSTLRVGVHRYTYTQHKNGSEDMFILFPIR
jgi:putative alpha-1,2-mannosidase